MASKIFSNYNDNGEYSGKDGDRLIIETGDTHIACMVKNDERNAIHAFEWFKHDKDEARDFEDLLNNAKVSSKLLGKYYGQTNVFINNEYSVLVPPSKFEKQGAEDYLNIVLGETYTCTSLFDDIEPGEGYVNAYRVATRKFDILNQHLVMVKIEHSYTQLLRQLLNNNNLPHELLKVQFYDSKIIVAILRDKKLQFIQSFTYQSADDVLYYLLSISQRLNLNMDHAVMMVSGMIETHSPLYTQLLRYFKNVTIETVDTVKLATDTGDYPAHYFTPIFNLAL